jgi:4'-phosphopantetheinyl transferase
MDELRRMFSAAIARGGPGASDGAHVTVGFAAVGDWMPWLDQAGRLLSPAEHARVRRMKRVSDAAARTLAYALHRLFVGVALGIDARDVPIARDDQGRPVLEGDWRTSLSHADGAFAFAVVRAAPLGIDLERRDRADGIADLEHDICHPGESAALLGLPDAVRARALLETWARKEAYLKASGVGLAHPMASFALLDGGLRQLAGDADASVVETGLLALHPAYVAALSRPPGMPAHATILLPG